MDTSREKVARILLVDDEPDIAFVLKIGLENAGYSVDSFTDPEDALTNFQAGKYDLLLSDIRMPKLNGFELYKQIKERDEKIRVCFMTAFDVYYEEFKKVFPSIDVKRFITKPIRIIDLVGVIREEVEKGNKDAN